MPEFFFDVSNRKKYFFCFFCFVACCAVLYSQSLVVNYLEWVDESETIVAIKLMLTGMDLFSEIFNHHGPLTFLFGYVLNCFFNVDLVGFRYLVILMQWVVALLIYCSPVHTSVYSRAISSLLFLLFSVYTLPEFYGHTYTYQTLAGLFLSAIFSVALMPLYIGGFTIGFWRAAIVSFLVVCLPFFAVTYLPIAFCIFLCLVRNSNWRGLIWGFFAALLCNLAWLFAKGNFTAFYVDHLYINGKILPSFNGSLTFGAIAKVLFEFVFGPIFWLSVVFLSFLLSPKLKTDTRVRSIILMAGLLSLCIRTDPWHLATFFYVIFTIAVLTPSLISKELVVSIFVNRLQFILLAFLPVLLIFVKCTDFRQKTLPQATDFGPYVHYFTKPSDRIIAFSFQNYEYLINERLPASGAFFFLPWQNVYNKNPLFGFAVNPCLDIKKYQPKIMMLDKWKVWGLYSWESYGACIDQIVAEKYIQIPGRPYFVRNDLLYRKSGIADPNENYVNQFTSSVADGENIELRFSKEFIESGAKIKAIDLLLTNEGHDRNGNVRIQFSSDVAPFQSFILSAKKIKVNQYIRFDLIPGHYNRGFIERNSSVVLKAWEAVSPNKETTTCMRYHFTNGQVQFTKGCPIDSL